MKLDAFYCNLCAWLNQKLDALANRPHWRRDTLFLSIVLSLFLAFPRYENFSFSDKEAVTVAFFEKADAPFEQHQYGNWLHESKLTFRMLPPLIAYVTGFRYLGMKVIESLTGVWILWVSLLLAEKITRNRRDTILITALIASIYAGSVGFVEYRYMFDSLAIASLLTAMLFKNPLLIFLSLTAGFWTDERALVAAAIVWCYHALPCMNDLKGLVTFHKKLMPWVIYATIAAYWAGRLALIKYCSLQAAWGDVGIGMINKHFNNFPLGLWSAYEGGWILIVGAMLVLFLLRKWFVLLCCGIALVSILLTGFSVIDITRTDAYGVGFLFVSLAILVNHSSKDSEIGFVRRCIEVATVICILWPSLHAHGKEIIWWHSPPFPVRLFFYLSCWIG